MSKSPTTHSPTFVVSVSRALTLVFLCIALLVLRVVMPNEMSALFDQIWAWLNQPLPIVGVSSIVLGFTIWKIFISTSFGKKCVADLEKEFEKLKADYEAKSKEAEDNKAKALAYKEEAVNMLASFKEELDTFAEQLAVACETSPNKNVKALATTIRSKKQELDTL